MKRPAAPPSQLPEALRDRFHALERLLWRVDTVIAISGAFVGLLFSYLLVFCSDRFWDTPGWLRLLLTGAGIGVVVYFVWGWCRLWIWQRRDTRALANVVQHHHRRLGDRLLGIVELADNDKRPADVSPALCRAAIAQVSAEAVQFDFRDAVAMRKPRLYFLGAMVLLLIVLAPFLFVPSASLNTLTRWLQPVSNVPRFTFVSLEQLPASLVVPHGEPFEIQCAAEFHHLWRSRHGTAQYGQQPPVDGRMLGNKLLFRVPGQTRPGVLTLRVGDVARKVSIEPTLRPALKQLTARIQLPSYLEYPPTESAVNNAALTFLEGSKVAFNGNLTRPLAAARVEMRNVDTNLDTARYTATVKDAQFQTQPLLLDGLDQGSFKWRDVLGLENAAPWLLTLQSRPDGVPEVDCPQQPGVVAILVDEVLEISAIAQDDFGLRQLGVAWECQKRQDTNVVARDESKIKEGSPQTTNLAGVFRLSPTLMKLPEETVVTLRATAEDYKPGRKRAQSAPYKIYVLGHEEHSQLVQQQFEKLLAEVEELTRRQEGLLESGRALKDLSPADQKSEETGRKLQEQASEQSALAEKTAKLAREGAETVREALRNKTIPTELLKEWTQQMENMQSLSQKQMPAASQSLSGAQQKPQERAEELSEALQTEAEILEKLQDLQKKLGPALDRMLANTLAQRLRKIARFEDEIEKLLQQMLPETIGLKAAQLPEKHRATTTRLATGQETSGRESQQLQEEITRFFQRTSVTNYGAVAQEMKESKVVENLSGNTELIRQNISAQAMQQADQFGTQFSQWAEKLEAAGKAQSSQGQGQPGEMPEAALQRLLALLRVRQTEVNLRQHTQVLEQLKPGRSSYREDSVVLSVRQSLGIDDVRELIEEDPGKYLAQARQSMGEAQNLLLKPATGDPTIAAETDAVNLLEAEIMSMMQSQQNKGQGAQMAMLMQMMGMTPGNRPGGNMSGGSTDKANNAVTGNTAGNPDGPRELEKTAGRDARPVPVEYREALQNYHKAIEKITP